MESKIRKLIVEIYEIDPHVFIGSGTHASYPTQRELNDRNPFIETNFVVGEIWWTSKLGELINVGEKTNYGKNMQSIVQFNGLMGQDLPGHSVVPIYDADSPVNFSFQENAWKYDEKI